MVYTKFIGRELNGDAREAVFRTVVVRSPDGGRRRAGRGERGHARAQRDGVVGQVELFIVSRLINCALEADDEFVCLDVHFVVTSGGREGVHELLHLLLSSPQWDESAFERSKEMHRTH